MSAEAPESTIRTIFISDPSQLRYLSSFKFQDLDLPINVYDRLQEQIWLKCNRYDMFAFPI